MHKPLRNCRCPAEMTGLDVESDQILQIAVICTGKRELGSASTFGGVRACHVEHRMWA